MAGLFIKTISLLKSTKITSVNRSAPVNLNFIVAGLKQDTKELLKSLNIPEKPKKPLTPYLKFCQTKRTEILKREPNLAQTELMRKCGEEWSKIDETEKQKLSQQYSKEQEKYTVEFSQYMAGLSGEQKEALLQAKVETKKQKERSKLRKANKEYSKPKRPLSAITRYLLDRSKETNMSYTDLLKTKTQWQDVPEAIRLKYEKDFQKDKERYEIELKMWEERMLSEGHTELVRKKVLHDEGAKKPKESSPKGKTSKKTEGKKAGPQ